jgi:serine/threonine protein kinase
VTLSAGSRLGPYEVLAPLGAGGMGEVYRARDTRLGREVAVKVLPEALSSDRDRLTRFEQEARSASALNHPNIVVVHDVGRSDSLSYIAMELVSGRSLREMMAAGPLPVRQILSMATQISEGLACAHAGGIAHRDLKPENVMVTDDGFVKILDFGLAKLAIPDAAALSSAPTAAFESPETRSGLILGTVGYMSPEQAAGRAVDYRSDQFSFGSILYEMATGRRAFQKESTAQTLAAIIEEEPEPVASVRPEVPPPLAWVIERCLAKSPAGRYESTRDLARELSNLKERISSIGQPAAVRSPGRRARKSTAMFGWVAAGLMLAALVASQLRTPRAPAAPETRSIQFSVEGPEGASFHSGEILTKTAISPDGRSLALVAFSGGRSRLYLRSLDSLTPRALTGTEDAQSPFWSPDGRFLGFVAAGKLKKIDTGGGPPQTLCEVSFEGTGTWNREGVILFAEAAPGREGIHRVPADGGRPKRVTAPDVSRNERFHFWPYFLPDGRHFLYVAIVVGKGGAGHEIRIGSLDSKEMSPLGRIASRIQYSPPGFLLFVQEGSLLARPFDPKSQRWTGEARPVADRLHYFFGPANAGFSVSDNGVLAYERGSAPSRLAWLGRDGREISTVATLEEVDDLRLSPEGLRVAIGVNDPRTGSSDIWVYDLTRNTSTRLTAEPTQEDRPVWTADGSRLVFHSDRNGPHDLFEIPAAGGAVRPFLERPGVQMAEDVSPDALLYGHSDRATGEDIWILPLSGERKPQPFLKTRFNESGARFSPDGRWIAYDSDESGSVEVYVSPREGGGARTRVSTAGGFWPRWRRDGRELFYCAPGRRMMAASVQAGPGFEADPARELFRVESTLLDYDVSADGRRFLVSSALKPPGPPITVIVNWPAQLAGKPESRP